MNVDDVFEFFIYIHFTRYRTRYPVPGILFFRLLLYILFKFTCIILPVVYCTSSVQL